MNSVPVHSYVLCLTNSKIIITLVTGSVILQRRRVWQHSPSRKLRIFRDIIISTVV